MFVLPLVKHVFFWVIIFLHRYLLRVDSLKYLFKTCPMWFMLLNLFFPDYIQTNAYPLE